MFQLCVIETMKCVLSNFEILWYLRISAKSYSQKLCRINFAFLPFFLSETKTWFCDYWIIICDKSCDRKEVIVSEMMKYLI